MSEEGQTNGGEGSAEASVSKGGFGSQGPQGDAPAQTPPEPINWRESITDQSIKDSPTIAQIKADTAQEAIDVMSKQLIHANQMIGADKMPKLKDNATPEERQAYFQEHFGVPEDKAGYDFGLPEDAGDDVKKVADLFKDIALEQNLNPEQAKAFYDKVGEHFGEEGKAQAEAKKAEIEAGLAGLQDEWGDRYQTNMNLANMAADRFGGDEFDKLLESSPEIANNPVLIKAFAQAGASLMDAPMHNTNSANHATPNVQAEVTAFETSPRWRELVGKKDLTLQEQAEYNSMLERRNNLWEMTR